MPTPVLRTAKNHVRDDYTSYDGSVPIVVLLENDAIRIWIGRELIGSIWNEGSLIAWKFLQSFRRRPTTPPSK